MEKQTIEVPLPHAASLTEFDLELMKATFQVLMSLRRKYSKEWKNILQEFEEDGWKVAWRLSWQAEARRGRDVEEAAASTLDEAFDWLRQLTRLDSHPLAVAVSSPFSRATPSAQRAAPGRRAARLEYPRPRLEMVRPACDSWNS